MVAVDCSYLCLDYIEWSIRVGKRPPNVHGQRGCIEENGLGRCPYLPDTMLALLGKTAEEILEDRVKLK